MYTPMHRYKVHRPSYIKNIYIYIYNVNYIARQILFKVDVLRWLKFRSNRDIKKIYSIQIVIIKEKRIVPDKNVTR